ncbi:MAG: hypothetical protein ABEJ85_04310 [Haloarculaceae archaeon]
MDAAGAVVAARTPVAAASALVASPTPTNATGVVGVTSNDSEIGVAAVVVAAVLVWLALYSRRGRSE